MNLLLSDILLVFIKVGCFFFFIKLAAAQVISFISTLNKFMNIRIVKEYCWYLKERKYRPLNIVYVE